MKRFYKQVSVDEAEGGWRVLLDGRPIRTAGRNPQILPTRALAQALAGEWIDQGEELVPKRFILRDLTDYAIDVVVSARERTIGELLVYGETDTLCYRGDAGEALHARQLEVWEPLLTAAEQRWDVHFERVGGIIHRPQPSETLARLRAVLEAQDGFSLAALQTLASLAASLVIALTAIEPAADAATLWSAANLEEDWQAALWGQDAEAATRRETRFEAFAATMRFAELARTES